MSYYNRQGVFNCHHLVVNVVLLVIYVNSELPEGRTMKSPKYSLHALLFTFLPISYLQAEILHVLNDHETIQAVIDSTEKGDTVLVMSGFYEENIS
ncbi:MAG: hypothetical protein HQ568_12025 [Calditrichaeota bacterium]|nr:hypothetical protein [Calditrichota bacterium]